MTVIFRRHSKPLKADRVTLALGLAMGLGLVLTFSLMGCGGGGASVSQPSPSPTVSPVSLTLAGASGTVAVGETLQFTASVSGTSNTAVTWSASAGTLTAAGLFTAPATPGTVTITATSVADSTKSASVQVEVFARPTPAAPVSAEQQIFTNGKDGYPTYRIPALVRAGNGDLLAFCEGRPGGAPDFGNIDIVMKRSTDNGVSWGPLQVVATNGTYQAGNPAPVVDPNDHDRVWLAYNISKNSEGSVNSGVGVREVMVISSTDHGATWSAPTNITTSVHHPNQTTNGYNYTDPLGWRTYANTPGHAIVLSSGRLLFVGNHSTSSSVYYSHCFYSDDHGVTWQLGGTMDRAGTNECQAVELADGKVLINMRNQATGHKYRAENLSSDGGLTWGTTTFNAFLPEPICEASILRLSTTKTSDRNRLLFCNPSTTASRANLCIKVSYDEGASYTWSRQINASGAYSDMVVQADHQIGVLYERSGGLFYNRFNLEWATYGHDTLGGFSYLLNATFQDLSGWSPRGTGTVEVASMGGLHLKDVSGASTGVFRQDITVPADYTLAFTAKVDAFSGLEDLGIKVANGAYLLGFQRHADGEYVLAADGTWTKLASASASTDWNDYLIQVNGSTATLYCKPTTAANWVLAGTWTLGADLTPSRIEAWAQGSASAPMEFHLQKLQVY